MMTKQHNYDNLFEASVMASISCDIDTKARHKTTPFEARDSKCKNSRKIKQNNNNNKKSRISFLFLCFSD